MGPHPDDASPAAKTVTIPSYGRSRFLIGEVLLRMMRGSCLILALVLTTVAPRSGFGQNTSPLDPTASSLAGPLKASSVDLPAGDGAWVVRLIRTGGFAHPILDVA